MDKLEKVLLIVLLGTCILGLYWGFKNPAFFTDRFMMEDGEIEYATVGFLLASCVLVGTRWIKLHKKLPLNFTVISFLIVVLFFFVAGEEISWGQRLIGIESSDYFKENNSQEELNLHNLVVDGVKINKLIFGLIMTSAIMGYIVLIPVLYWKINTFTAWIDRWYIPVPKVYQSAAYLVLTLIISIIPASKNWELLEFGSVLIFFLILWAPQNPQLHRTLSD